MVLRITVYGWVVGNPTPTQAGYYRAALVDLVYFVDDPEFNRLSPQDRYWSIRHMIQDAGFKIFPKYVDGKKSNGIESPQIEVEDWDKHLKIGVENTGERIPYSENLPPEDGFNRYNTPPPDQGMI